MEYRYLARTGVRVSELCLGAMTFGRELSEQDSIRLIDRFIEVGGNFIDTANVYSDGRSEEIVGNALKGKRDRFVVATKVRFRRGEDINDIGLSRRHIVSSCDASLRRLQTDYIDLYQIHSIDPNTSLEETLSTLNDLVHAGKVRSIGVSNFTGWQLMKALSISDRHGWARFVCLQPRYNLVDRYSELELLPLCQEEGLGVIPWSPLAGGFLTGKYQRNQSIPDDARIAHAETFWPEHMDNQASERSWRTLDVVRRIAAERSKTPAQVALAWVRDQPGVTAPILGARSMPQLDDNLGCIGWRLTAEEMKSLTDVSSLEYIYPYSFIRDFAYKE